METRISFLFARCRPTQPRRGAAGADIGRHCCCSAAAAGASAGGAAVYNMQFDD